MRLFLKSLRIDYESITVDSVSRSVHSTYITTGAVGGPIRPRQLVGIMVKTHLRILVTADPIEERGDLCHSGVRCYTILYTLRVYIRYEHRSHRPTENSSIHPQCVYRKLVRHSASIESFVPLITCSYYSCSCTSDCLFIVAACFERMFCFHPSLLCCRTFSDPDFPVDTGRFSGIINGRTID
jgi:hypothetical protein